MLEFYACLCFIRNCVVCVLCCMRACVVCVLVFNAYLCLMRACV